MTNVAQHAINGIAEQARGANRLIRDAAVAVDLPGIDARRFTKMIIGDL
jgi:hypothetical protein